MNYIVINDYITYGGQRYVVFYFTDIDIRNEITVDANTPIDEAAEKLYNALILPPPEMPL